jgi:histidinol-phosphate aminotransferase
MGALAERGVDMADSHTNFVFFDLGEGAEETVEEMTAKGVLVRGFGPNWVRMTIGNDEENRRFLEALDSALTSH